MAIIPTKEELTALRQKVADDIGANLRDGEPCEVEYYPPVADAAKYWADHILPEDVIPFFPQHADFLRVLRQKILFFYSFSPREPQAAFSMAELYLRSIYNTVDENEYRARVRESATVKENNRNARAAVAVKAKLNSQARNKCARCGKFGCFKRCGGCKVTFYCSAECQTEHWSAPADGHKAACKRLAAADAKE